MDVQMVADSPERLVWYERRDGRVVIELRGEHAFTTLEPGHEGTLVERVMRPTGTVDLRLVPNPNGVPGNVDPSKTRYHGWRGTTNDVARHALGWRRVESVEPRKRGQGYRIVLSPDLLPDAA